ncbi:hypothetical protein [Thauera sinica]|uniref:DUF3102 domain-containing protein n=1 Tax=Thauera sinica TaxID=2665146 RepID=A0ABW1AY99_9RHOO|nr:hypothetical protein [Thauera sp. K11]
MPRKPLPPPAEKSPVDLTAVEADLQAADAARVVAQQQDARVRAVALQIGYQLPADATSPELIARDIAANMRRTVEACLEIGRGLIVLKEACAHGQFGPQLAALGIDVNVAGRFMAAARKIPNSPTSANLARAIGSQSKLLELLILDDEQVEELALTGQTGELALDDVARMSTTELRAALRKIRREKTEEKEAGERNRQRSSARINELESEIDQLQRKLAGKPKPTPAEEAALREQWALDALSAAATRVVASITAGLRRHIQTLEEQFGDEVPPNHARLAERQAIEQVIQAARVLASDYGIDLPLSTQTPQELAWLTNMELLDAMRADDVPQPLNGDIGAAALEAGLAAEGWTVLDDDFAAGAQRGGRSCRMTTPC